MSDKKRVIDTLLKQTQESLDKAHVRLQEKEMAAKIDEHVTKKMDEIREELNLSKEAFGSFKDEVLGAIKEIKGHGNSQDPITKFTYTDQELQGMSANDRTRVEMQKMIMTPAKEQGSKAEIALKAQQDNDTLVMLKHYTGNSWAELGSYRKCFYDNTELAKAIDTNTSGVGLEWVPTMMSANFIERIEQEYRLASMFRQFRIPSGTKSVDFPASGNAMNRFVKLSPTSDDNPDKITAFTPSSAKRTLTPVKFGGRIEVEEDAVEDAIIDVINQVTIPEAVQNAAFTVDYAIVNGDTSATHQDGDTTASDDSAKSWDGLRILTPSAAKVSMSNGDIEPDDLLNLLSLLHTGRNIYNRKLDDILIIMSNVAYINLHKSIFLLTKDVAGNDSTIFNGFLSNIFGPSGMVDTAAVREDLNASGVYDGVTTDRTLALITNKNAFTFGTKRDVRVKSDEDIVRDRRRIVLTMRVGFVGNYPSTHPVVGQLYNVNA